MSMIEAVGPDSPHYQRVIELGNANSATLGFLPYEAIKQAAEEGRVLAFVEDGEVKGYALYGKRVRTGDISLTHLCVDKDQRGQGIARELVEGIVERNPRRAGIRLSCRKDYDANDMWPKLGFTRWGEKPGRSRAGHLLVTWWRPIAAQTLFGEPDHEDARLLVAIDTNILLDILEQRDFPASLALTADWVEEVAELAVTAQSRSELSDQRSRSDGFESKLREFRILEPSSEAWHAELESLQQAPSAARIRVSDLRVVAQAATSDAAYFVTRDKSLLKHGKHIEQSTGLSLVGPDDFLLRLQASGGEHSHQSRAIAASGMSVATVSRMPTNTELSVYCHHHVGESPADIRQRLSKATAHEGRIKQIETESGEPVALGAMYREQSRVTVTALRSASGQHSYSAARQMIHHLRTAVAKEGSAGLVIEDQTQSPVERALRDEGFRSEGAIWKAAVQTGMFGPGDALPQELSQIGWNRLTANLIRDYERYAWPSKVFSGAVTSYFVPIKPEYARVLLGYEEPQARLFEMHLRAAAARDNTYYMAPRQSVEAPARIIWWVSGGGRFGGVRAMSWLDTVDTGDPRRLYRQYRDRGVLDKPQVLDSAKSSGKGGHPKATALLFSQTEIFHEPIPIGRARELCPAMNTDGYFITTREIDEASVQAFYEEGLRQHG
ncbi:GNAT family N-acetyltransferase [Candidatus Poriferisocius sp.]|uniref:GNAT family N-acetyltransferase n=1 Tax=Candidatus Poriferisocius sp. TaxID=3101276 RepID=UPI003B5246F1